jgi:hypothetical protein
MVVSLQCYHLQTMSRLVIVAPDDLAVLEDPAWGPVVYLAGPIQGAQDWQADAINLLGNMAPDLHIASPRATAFVGGADRHLAWEQAFIERAAQNGVVLFYCAKEISHRCNRTYAAQMRFELGEWAVKAQAGLARLVVGIEKGFTGGPYLQRRFTLHYPNVVVCRTLRQTCAAAAETARRQSPVTVYPRALDEMFVPNFGLKNNG